jgi:hypothetical protein
VRFDRELPADFQPPRWIGKPARKILESLRGQRSRFRADHLPVDGQYGVDLWKPGEIVRDSFTVELPRDVAEGEYAVRVKIMAEPVYPDYRLSDLFFDDDSYAGHQVGWVRIGHASASPGRRAIHEGH